LIATLCCLAVVTGGVPLAIAATAPSVQSDQPQKQPHIRAALVSEHDTLIPGKTSWIGLDLSIEKAWHTYWNGRNETGTPPAVKWSVPPGFKVGEAPWPAPRRYILNGDTLDHIYEDRVLLMVPLEVPADAKPGTKVEIKAACTFVVCQDVCVMEKAALALTLTVGELKAEPKKSAAAAQFEKARKSLPVPMRDAPGVTAKVEGSMLVVTAKGAAKVSFFPFEDSAGTPNLLKEGETKGERLSVALEPSESAGRVRGVVEAKGGQLKEPVYVSVDLEVPR
jgi:DsbC/DsbD-like thiol-disulfide interchange protein